MAPHSVFSFGPFRIDLANERLWRGPQPLALKPKAFAVLRSLIERPQQLVTKAELLDAHWPGVAVGEAVLKTCILEIRQAFTEDSGSPACIETVHRRGYRFVAPLSPIALPSPQPGLHAPRALAHITPLVGRATELAMLAGWWEWARQGDRQVILLTGEPGIGKTRLVDTFAEQLATAGDAWIGRGQCVKQYGAGEAFLPILEALGRLCRHPEGGPLVTVLKRYAPTWIVQLPGVLEAAEVHALRPAGPGATPSRVMRELAEAVEALTVDHPLLLLVEDLHWIDASSLECLTYLSRRAGPARLLVIGTYRPADVILHAHPLKGVKEELLLHAHCQELRLEGLAETAVAEYVRHRLREGMAPGSSFQPVVRLVYQRTEGNPLFMVNVVDYLVRQRLLVQEDHQWKVQGDLGGATVPTGLRQFIELRLAQLDAADRRLLEVASMAGSAFTTAMVAAGLDTPIDDIDGRCHELARGEQFIGEEGKSEWPDGTVAARYEFLHALYQETLYDRLPLTQRVDLHRRIAERMERGYQDRCREVAAELALHFERGQEPDRASHYHQQAGEEAMRRSAFQEAIGHLTRAIELLKTLPASPEQVQRELILYSTLGLPLMHLKGFDALETVRAFGRARELCRQFPQSPHVFPILMGLFRFYHARGERPVTDELVEELLTLAKQADDPALLLMAHQAGGYALWHRGNLDAARHHFEHALSCYRPEEQHSLLLRHGEDHGLLTQLFLALALWTCGYAEQGLQRERTALAGAREVKHPFMLAGMLLSVAAGHVLRQEAPAALQLAEESVALATKEGFSEWVANALAIRGWAKAMLGELDEGIADLEQGIAFHREFGHRVFMTFQLACLGEVCAGAGRIQEGLAAVTEALALVNGLGDRWYEAELIRLKGELILGMAEQDRVQREREAEGYFQQAIRIARGQGAKSFELRAVMSLCRLWDRLGKRDHARQMLLDIYTWFTEGFETRDLQAAKALLEQLGHR